MSTLLSRGSGRSAGGSGLLSNSTAILATSFSNATTTLADVPSLQVQLGVGEVWSFQYDLNVSVLDNTGSLGFKFLAPAGATSVIGAMFYQVATPAITGQAVALATLVNLTVGAANGSVYMAVRGVVTNSTTPGVFKMQAAGFGAGTVTISSVNSSLQMRRLA